MKSRYSVIIQWSPEDKCYVVTLPEWGGCHTHGDTYVEAAKAAEEVLELLQTTQEKGQPLPKPEEFVFPGPTGYVSEEKRKVPNRRASA